MTYGVNMTTRSLLTTSEAAELLNVVPTTIRHWANIGRLPFITTLGGHRRFDKNEILSLLSNTQNSKYIKRSFAILIIDDKKEYLAMLVTLLKTSFPHVTITCADNGFDAGDLLHRFKPDLIILDLTMESIDGFSICHRIKNTPSTSNIKIIAMSSLLTDDNVKGIIQLGVETCIQKPFSHEQIKQIISPIIFQ
jgi:excisionase family DNA binding protein